MFDSPYEYDARELKKALSTVLGDEDDNIIEIFASRPKDYLNVVDIAYKKFYGISLKEEIQNQLPKQFAEFLLLLMDSDRPDEQTISGDDAYEMAQELINNGTKAYATDAELFKKIFVEKSRIDLILVSRAYFELCEKYLYDAFEEENVLAKSLFNEEEEEKKLKNKNIKLIKALIFTVITPAEFFSKKLISALRGINGDINTLLRVLITRTEIDIDAINEYYIKEAKRNGNVFVNEFDLGYKTNFKMFFNIGIKTPWWLMLLPVKVPPYGDGINFPSVADNVQLRELPSNAVLVKH